MTRFARLLAPFALCAAFVAAATIPSTDTALEIDPHRTKVEFTLGDILHTVHGSFLLTRGNIRFNTATGMASGELVVDATTGDSGSPARDRRMHSHILESDRFHEIVFRPDRVEGKVALQGPSQVQLHGLFTIHGEEHEVTLRVDVTAADGEFDATAHFLVPYVKWGMKNPSTLFLRVNDKVEISIHTVAHRASS